MLRLEVVQARQQRKELSYPEVLLWQRLRGKSTGARFRKQHPIGPYVVDFYCSALRLVIEVDGQVHATPEQLKADPIRDRFIRENGHQIFRVSAGEILRDADAVAASIAALVALPLHHASHVVALWPAPGRPRSRPGDAISCEHPPRSGEDQGRS